MQIHELNNFTGTLGSGAYLAVDDGNDTGKLSTQQLLAATEARIDNIIAGPAPSAEEIVDARLGDDGVTYPSLGDAIRDQVGDLKSAINYTDVYIQQSKLKLESGTYADDTGISKVTNVYRQRTPSPLCVENIYSVTVPTGYSAWFFFLDATLTKISANGWIDSGVEYKKTLFPTGTKYVNVVVKNADGTDISNAEIYIPIILQSDIDIAKNKESIDTIANEEEVALFSWTIGFIYATGGFGPATNFPQYVCTKETQNVPYDIVIRPDNGYQMLVRLYENGSATPTTNSAWLTGSYRVPAGTNFKINMSKIVLENVGSASEYATHIHIRYVAVDNFMPEIKLQNVRMAVLGDSISTYSGYTENATDDGTTNPYYPTGDVTNVATMWWAKVAEWLGISVSDVAVSAVSRSSFVDQSDATIPCGYNTTRINRLGSKGTPTHIFVELGTNDAFGAQTASIPYETDITNLEALPNTTVKGISLTIRKIQNSYPSAKIILLIPKQVNLAQLTPTGYDCERVTKIADEIAYIAEMMGAWKVIDLRRCGINQTNVASCCQDGQIHPNAKGMELIANYIMDCLR